MIKIFSKSLERRIAYNQTFTVALQRSSKQMLKMVLTSAQLTSKMFSTFLKSIV